MSNFSDRGGAGPSYDVLGQLHREDLERHARGEPAPLDIGDVRLLDSARIAEIGVRMGDPVVAAAAIAAAAAKQLAGIKLTTAALPSGRRLHRVGDDSHLTADDVDWLNTRALQQARMRALAYETHVNGWLAKALRELTGDDYQRANRIFQRLSEAQVKQLLAVPKKERRKALARALEQLETNDE